jgi:hypothetical protein
MATTTTRLSLRKPDPNPTTGDFVDAQADLNNNWDNLDGKMPFVICTSGTRPGAPFQGMQIWETDTSNALFWNGAAWKRIWVVGHTTPVPDAYISERTLVTDPAFRSRITGDTNYRYDVSADGKGQWGPGGVAPADTNFYRSAAGILKTDGQLLALGNVTGSQFLPSIAAGYMYNQRVYFTAGGTFTKASYPGLRAVRVMVLAAGGGSGGAGATIAGQGAAGGGGGGGGYTEKFILAAALGAAETVTVGTGGAVATVGGNSSFGVLCVSAGGGGGEAGVTGASQVVTAGGSGGLPTTGDIGVRGQDGGNGLRSSTLAHGGFGGLAALGWSGGSRPGGGDTTAAGIAGGTYGGGASGGHNLGAQSAVNGAIGGNGIVIVDIFI